MKLSVAARSVITDKDIMEGICDRPIGWCYSILMCAWFHPRYIMRIPRPLGKRATLARLDTGTP